MAKLKPRARLIRTIGDRLISGPEAAIIELVKNSYDADSPSVEITIIPPSSDFSGKIIVKDEGHGMSYENILNDWLEPATDTKNKNKSSRSGSRQVLGAKGVGRFASASLGKSLKMTSVSKLDNEIYEISTLSLDWDIFENKKYLEDIDIDIDRRRTGNLTQSGVTIEIFDISTIWNEKKLRKLIRELRRLATPQYSLNTKFSIYLNLEKFTKDLDFPYNFDGKQLLDETNKLAEILQNSTDVTNEANLIKPYLISGESDYHLSGSFDEKGRFEGKFSIVRGDNFPIDLNFNASELAIGETSCGPVKVDLRIYDLEPESVEKLFERMGLNFSDFGLRGARQFISENTGVGIYRNGFRIRPYGESDNDWLKLESRRVQDPSKKIGHGQISGTLSVGSESESSLIERSSREGLENNSAFERLTELIIDLLIKIEQKRYDFRTKAGISRKPAKNIGKAREIASLESLSKAVSYLPVDIQKPLLDKIIVESIALTKTLDEIEEYQKLLESRAALGMVVAQVIHDGRTYLEPISSSAQSIINNAPFLLDDTKKGEVIRKYYPTYGQAILDGAKGLSSLFKALDPISGRRRGKPIKFQLSLIIVNTLNLLSDNIIESNIEIENTVDDSILLYGYPGDLQSALMNIVQNAIYWLSTIQDRRIISISSLVEDEYSVLSIVNNGPIISDDNKNKIFEAGFSLKTGGHGLGLSIAKEACRNSYGDLFLSTDSGYTNFLIKFPLNK